MTVRRALNCKGFSRNCDNHCFIFPFQFLVLMLNFPFISSHSKASHWICQFFFCIRFTQIVACIYDLAFARSACARRTRIPLLFIFHTSFNCRRFIYLFSVFLVYIKISSLEHAFISHLFSFLSGASFSFKMCALMPVCLFCVRLFVCLMHDWYESEYGWQKDISLQKAS